MYMRTSKVRSIILIQPSVWLLAQCLKTWLASSFLSQSMYLQRDWFKQKIKYWKYGILFLVKVEPCSVVSCSPQPALPRQPLPPLQQPRPQQLRLLRLHLLLLLRWGPSQPPCPQYHPCQHSLPLPNQVSQTHIIHSAAGLYKGSELLTLGLIISLNCKIWNTECSVLTQYTCLSFCWSFSHQAHCSSCCTCCRRWSKGCALWAQGKWLLRGWHYLSSSITLLKRSKPTEGFCRLESRHTVQKCLLLMRETVCVWGGNCVIIQIFYVLFKTAG